MRVRPAHGNASGGAADERETTCFLIGKEAAKMRIGNLARRAVAPILSSTLALVLAAGLVPAGACASEGGVLL